MPKKSIKLGDVFALGEHKLACGDARDPKIVSVLLGDDHVSLVLVDPPYGCAVVESKADFLPNARKHKVIQNDHDQSEAEYRRFTHDWLTPVIPYLRRQNALYIFNSDKMIFALRDGLQDSGCKFAQLLIWIKNQAVIGRMDYLPQHELVAYAWHGTHKFYKAKDKSVLIYPRPSKSTLHPTMKPVGLLRRLILNSSKIADIIYDPFIVSGSTLLACEQTKRQCRAIELDPGYCQVVIDRFEKLTGLKAKLINSK
jgi:site-specific DNA-methyltransferase (adenine-specific)